MRGLINRLLHIDSIDCGMVHENYSISSEKLMHSVENVVPFLLAYIVHDHYPLEVIVSYTFYVCFQFLCVQYTIFL